MATKKERQEDRINFIVQRVRDAREATHDIRMKWRENYIQFAYGSQFPDKEQWQSDLSLGRFEARVRKATSSVRNILINQPNWFMLEARNPDDELSKELEPTLEKIIKYYLERSNFTKFASSFLLSSFISMGSLSITWKPLLVQNPESTAKKQRKQEREDAERLADKVVNPPAGREFTEQEVVESSENALNALQALLSGEDLEQEEEELKPYIQIGVPDIQIINPECRYWDPNVAYMTDSTWGSYRYMVRISDLKLWAEQGLIDKKVLEEIGAVSHTPEEMKVKREIFSRVNPRVDNDVVEVTVYFGPVEEPNRNEDKSEITFERYGAIILNESIMLKEWEEYPYWEPPGHSPMPFVDTAVKEVPFRATGAGVGDNAVKLARTLDANVNLRVDAARYNLIGFTVVDYNSLVDRGILEEGIEPGQIIEVRGKAKDAVEHVSLTNNIEGQTLPTDLQIDDAIDEAMGTSELALGGQTQRSRVTAAEISTRSQGTQDTANNTALDLEQQFLLPFLEKLQARILQFGLKEVESNPELSFLLSDREKSLLASLTTEDRLAIMNQYYKFKIKGFSTKLQDQEEMQRLTEVLQIVNSGGPVSQRVNVKALTKRILDKMNLSDDSGEPLFVETEFDRIQLENELLQSDAPRGRYVETSDTDNHEAHLQQHELESNPTQAMQQHKLEHQQRFAQQQAAQQQSQEVNQGEPPIQ